MSPGWSPPPTPQWRPPPPPRRYATKWIWIGLLVGTIATIGLSAAGFGAGTAVGQSSIGGLLFGVGLFAPLVLGTVLTAKEGTPPRRGFGLGLIIGWALAPIVFAGVCLVIVLGAYSQAGA